MSDQPTSSSPNNVEEWNKAAKGTPFEGMGEVLDNAVKGSMQKRQDLIDRVSNEDAVDEILSWPSRAVHESVTESKGYDFSDTWPETRRHEIIEKHKAEAKQAIEALINQAKIDENKRWQHVAENSWDPNVHLETIKGRIAQLSDTPKEEKK